MVTCKCDGITTTIGVPPIKVLSFFEKLCDLDTGECFFRFYDFGANETSDYDIAGDLIPDGVANAGCCDYNPGSLGPTGAGLETLGCTFDAEGVFSGRVFTCKTLIEGEETLTSKWIGYGSAAYADYDPEIHGAWEPCEPADQNVCEPVIDASELIGVDTATYEFTAPVESVEIINCSPCIVKAIYNLVGGNDSGNSCQFILPGMTHAIMMKDGCLIDAVEVQNTKGGDFQVYINGLKSS